MPRGRKKGFKVPVPGKIEDIDTGKRYVWVLVRFSDSRVFKIPAEMIAEIRLAQLGRERDLEFKNEILSSKTGLKAIADSLEWVDVVDRAFLYDGKLENVIADERSEWKTAKKWVEEDLKVRHV